MKTGFWGCFGPQNRLKLPEKGSSKLPKIPRKGPNSLHGRPAPSGGVWIGGVWNGHFPESRKYLSDAGVCTPNRYEVTYSWFYSGLRDSRSSNGQIKVERRLPSQHKKIHTHSFLFWDLDYAFNTHTHTHTWTILSTIDFELDIHTSCFFCINLSCNRYEMCSWWMNSNSIRIHIRQKIAGNSKCIYSRAHGSRSLRWAKSRPKGAKVRKLTRGRGIWPPHELEPPFE